MDSNTNTQISDKQLLQLWDIHVGYETGTPASKELPLCDEDKLNFARAVLQSASASRAELLDELRDVLDWAVTERAPLRAQEMASIRALIAKHTKE
jgi:hypothetical protein